MVLYRLERMRRSVLYSSYLKNREYLLFQVNTSTSETEFAGGQRAFVLVVPNVSPYENYLVGVVAFTLAGPGPRYNDLVLTRCKFAEYVFYLTI